MKLKTFIFRVGLDKVPVLSCTDKSCGWAQDHSKVLKDYDPIPIISHPAFNIRPNHYKMHDDFNEESSKSVLENLPDVSYSKHCKGRHELKEVHVMNSVPKLTDDIKKVISAIFENLKDSPMHKWLSKLNVGDPKKCCEKIYSKLDVDCVKVCQDTFVNFDQWSLERKYRISGSRIYSIFTYSKNKDPDWVKKCKNYFDPKGFTSEYTDHGIRYEDDARNVFCEQTGYMVHQIGSVISPTNRWLLYSADGVVFCNEKIFALLEIKSLYAGKDKNVLDALNDKKCKFRNCLETDGAGNLIRPFKMKQKHIYYGQIQTGMFMLNLQKAFFVIFASFDRSIEIINVDYDSKFVAGMLKTVKKTYFNIMLHAICDKEICENQIANVQMEV